MIGRSNQPETNFVTAFLSCSVRSEDRPLVNTIEERVLTPMGFRCLTVGRSLSLLDHVDDAIRQIMQRVDCLIGIATVRFEAADRSVPNQTLRLASPYLLEETAMAHQRRVHQEKRFPREHFAFARQEKRFPREHFAFAREESDFLVADELASFSDDLSTLRRTQPGQARGSVPGSLQKQQLF